MFFCHFYQFVFIYLLLIKKYCLGLVYFLFLFQFWFYISVINFSASNYTTFFFWIIAKTTFLIF